MKKYILKHKNVSFPVLALCLIAFSFFVATNLVYLKGPTIKLKGKSIISKFDRPIDVLKLKKNKKKKKTPCNLGA